jgi:hypothetical protein
MLGLLCRQTGVRARRNGRARDVEGWGRATAVE